MTGLMSLMMGLMMTRPYLDAAGPGGLVFLILGGIVLAVFILVIPPIIALIVAIVMAIKDKRKKEKKW